MVSKQSEQVQNGFLRKKNDDKKYRLDKRFYRPRSKNIKTKIDERFSSMMGSDDTFAKIKERTKSEYDDSEFGMNQKVDIYGRIIQANDWAIGSRASGMSAQKSGLSRYYYQDDDSQKKVQKNDMEEDNNEPKFTMEMLQGIGLPENSDSEAEGESRDEYHGIASGDSDLEDGTIVKFRPDGPPIFIGPDEQDQSESEDEEIPTGPTSKRLSLVNFDFESVSAADIFKMFQSFLPSGGVIENVKIVYSEFGRKRMDEEAKFGPPKWIFKGSNSKKGQDINEDTSDEDNAPNDSNAFDPAALRKYQLERLRYYYAIISLDSEKTASHIYRECDGIEYGSSSIILDLRFIPKDIKFNFETQGDLKDEEFKELRRHWLKEESDGFEDGLFSTQKASENLSSPTTKATSVLQLTNPKCTWDQDEPDRIRVLRKKWTKDELQDMDFSTYLASENSASESDLENNDIDPASARENYLKLLGMQKSENKDDQEESSSDEEMEITFTPGLSDLGSKLLERKKERKDQEHETVFEKYLREKKEKRKQRKKERKLHKASENNSDSDQIPDDLAHDPFFKDAYDSDFELKSTKKQRKITESLDESVASKAELELLMMDENYPSSLSRDPNANHSDDDLILGNKSKRKVKRKKGKKSGSSLPEDIEEDIEDFEVDVNDDRFSALFTSSQFAIDPTESRFKKTKGTKKILEEKRKRQKFGKN